MKAKALKYWKGLNKKGKILALAIVIAVVAGIMWS